MKYNGVFSLKKYHSENKGKGIWCFGAGNVLQAFSERFLEDGIVNAIEGVLDNNKAKEGTTVTVGKRILSIKLPQILKLNINNDQIIVITSVYCYEILEQLRNMNVPDSIECYAYVPDEEKARFKIAKVQEERRIFLINTPEHGNLGDHAIAKYEIQFLKEHFQENIIEWPGEDFRNNMLREYFINAKDILVISGGGYLGTLWQREEELVRQIMKEYPDNLIVIMPQTIYYSSDAYGNCEFEKSKVIYNAHKKLLLCARDRVSFETMKNAYGKDRVTMAPDMVLYSKVLRGDCQQKGILICLKSDKESILDRTMKERIVEVANQYSSDIMFTDTVVDTDLTNTQREEFLKNKIAEFQSAKLVITDRLHGMIFAAITETPCIALDNCNHKMRETFKWISNLHYIKYCTNLEKMPILIEELIAMGKCRYDYRENSRIFNELAEQMRKSMDK